MAVTIGGIPVFDAIISDEGTGMFKISLVDDSAVMTDFQAFDNTRKQVMYAVQDEEKRLVRGVVMRADFPIYRRSPEMGEYYIIYRAEQIRRMAEKYLVEARQNNINLMHQEGSDVDGVNMVQYFIKGDGVTVDGFDECADGSLFAEFHVTNDDVWNAIKEGTYKGFSLEGVFELQPEMDKEKVTEIVDELDGAFSRIFKRFKNKKETMSKFSRLKAALARFLQEMGNITTDKGVLSWDGDDDIKVGDSVFIEDADGNQAAAEDGDYTTDDNRVIVVSGGSVSDIREADAAPEQEPDTPEEMESISTDQGTLSYEGELGVGTEVFIVNEDGSTSPAPDGEYMGQGIKITVAEGKVSEIEEEDANPDDSDNGWAPPTEDEYRALVAERDNLKDQLEKLKKMSVAKPAHQQMNDSAKMPKTGVKGLDNLARIMSAK